MFLFNGIILNLDRLCAVDVGLTTVFLVQVRYPQDNNWNILMRAFMRYIVMSCTSSIALYSPRLYLQF